MIEHFINATTAIGTLALASIAIWGDRIRAWLVSPNLVIESHNLSGDTNVLTADGKPLGRVIYYHLRVANRHPWLTAKNCRVMLVGLSRRGPDGLFHPLPLVVPMQFVWAPASFAPVLATINKQHIVDFGYVKEGDDSFHPALYSTPNNFEGPVHAGKAVRFELAIEAEGFISKANQVFEVAWDGTWDAVPAIMQQHLRIREISEP